MNEQPHHKREWQLPVLVDLSFVHSQTMGGTEVSGVEVILVGPGCPYTGGTTPFYPSTSGQTVTSTCPD